MLRENIIYLYKIATNIHFEPTTYTNRPTNKRDPCKVVPNANPPNSRRRSHQNWASD